MNKLQLTAVVQLLCDFAYACQRVVTDGRYVFYFGIYERFHFRFMYVII